MSLRVIKYALSAAIVSLVAVFGMACGAIGGDDEGASGVRVSRVVFSDAVDQAGQPVNARTFFAPNSREIRAFVVVEGAAVGNKLRGAWYQLGTPDAGAVGQEINSSDITLDEVQDGRSLITFTLSPGQGSFPEDSWLLRVYSGDKLLRTSAFIVTRFAQVNASPPAGGSPAATATPTSYTVTSGDTLNSIATRFKPANEDQTAFLNRMAQLNNIPANSTLQPGQVIRVPGANP